MGCGAIAHLDAHEAAVVVEVRVVELCSLEPHAVVGVQQEAREAQEHAAVRDQPLQLALPTETHIWGGLCVHLLGLLVTVSVGSCVTYRFRNTRLSGTSLCSSRRKQRHT